MYAGGIASCDEGAADGVAVAACADAAEAGGAVDGDVLMTYASDGVALDGDAAEVRDASFELDAGPGVCASYGAAGYEADVVAGYASAADAVAYAADAKAAECYAVYCCVASGDVGYVGVAYV